MKPSKRSRDAQQHRRLLLASAAYGGERTIAPISDVLRNISLIAWPKQSLDRPPPPMRIAAPLDGRGMSGTMLNVLNNLERLKSATVEQIDALGPDEIPKGRQGAFFDLAHWTRSSFLLLKSAQCRYAARGREHAALMSRYLLKPGLFHDPEGFSQQKHDDARDNKKRLNAHVFGKEVAGGLTILALSPSIFSRPEKQQIQVMRASLNTAAVDLYTRYFDDLFPVEFFTSFFDFSEHSDRQILSTLKKLRPSIEDPEFRSQLPDLLLAAFDHSDGFLDTVLEEAAEFPR